MLTQCAQSAHLPPLRPAVKLFIGGISWETVEVTLSDHFSKFGELEDCVLMTNKFNGTPRGFAFVTFKDPAVVPAVLRDQVGARARGIDGRMS